MFRCKVRYQLMFMCKVRLKTNKIASMSSSFTWFLCASLQYWLSFHLNPNGKILSDKKSFHFSKSGLKYNILVYRMSEKQNIQLDKKNCEKGRRHLNNLTCIRCCYKSNMFLQQLGNLMILNLHNGIFSCPDFQNSKRIYSCFIYNFFEKIKILNY